MNLAAQMSNCQPICEQFTPKNVFFIWYIFNSTVKSLTLGGLIYSKYVRMHLYDHLEQAKVAQLVGCQLVIP